MHSAQKNMIVAGDANDSCAKQWTLAKVEAFSHLRPCKRIVLAVGIRGTGDIHDRKTHGETGRTTCTSSPPSSLKIVRRLAWRFVNSCRLDWSADMSSGPRSQNPNCTL